MVGPHAAAPVAVAAGLRGEQVVEGLAVTRVIGVDAPAQGAFVEERARPFRRDQGSQVIRRNASITSPAPIRRSPCSRVPEYSSITRGRRP